MVKHFLVSMLTVLTGIAVLSAQPVHFQPAQRDMMGNIMMLQANPEPPKSGIRYDCETNQPISKIDFEYDGLGRPVTETETTYASDSTTRLEMTYGGPYPTLHPDFSVNSTTDYSRMLTVKLYQGKTGNLSLILSTEWQYDASGFLTEKIEELIGYPPRYYTGESKADAQNRIIYESWTGEVPYLITQTCEYEYGANGKVKKSTLLTTSEHYTSISETTYTYNNKDFLDELIIREEDGSIMTKHKYIYDNEGRNIKIEMYVRGICTYIIYDYVSINELQAATISVYPNPTTGELKIDNGQFTIENFKIFNVMGQIVMQGTDVINGICTINVSHLPSGMYYLKMENKTVKFVKE